MMKKWMCIMLSLAVLLSTGTMTAAFAEEAGITEKELTAYIYSKDKTGTLKCLFRSGLPDMAYISTVDFLSHAYVEAPVEVKNEDGTYTVSNSGGTMVIDPVKDTLHFDGFEGFSQIQPNVEGSELDAPYLKETGYVFEGEIAGLDLDLGAYGLDILEYDGKTWFPASTISLLFGVSYNAAVYSGGCIWFVHSSDLIGSGSYFSDMSAYNTLERSEDLAKLTYSELCLTIDRFYGKPAQAEIASELEEKSFDQMLAGHSDETRRARELLQSTNIVDYLCGMGFMARLFKDGGHTAIYMPAFIGLLYSGTAVQPEMEKAFTEGDDMLKNMLLYVLTNQGGQPADPTQLDELRTPVYESETVRTWDDQTESRLVIHGDTAVFVFNAFLNEAVYHFKEALDLAKEKGVKRFVIDVSCNPGGSTNIVMYMLAMITNRNRDRYTSGYRKIQTITGNIIRTDHENDLNLDGEINDLDKEVYYDFDYAILTSKSSYSSGNLLPCLAKNAGIPILGERSGGGSCSILIIYSPERYYYTISSYTKLIDGNGVDVDSGAELDYDLTKIEKDEAGNETVDYSGMYDLDDIGEKIDAFYDIR